jgi:hypothetical protein
MDDNPASDGETFYITALLFAAQVRRPVPECSTLRHCQLCAPTTQRWGDDGAWNYTAEASLVLRAVVGKEAPPCGPQGCQSVVNMFGGFADANPPLVVFVPYASGADGP